MDDYPQLPEAPFSDNFDYVDTDGFSHKLTIRAFSAVSLFDQVSKARTFLKEHDCAPTGQKSYGTKPVTPRQNKPDQDDCDHEHVTLKKSTGKSKPENAGRFYNACLDCGKFMSWEDETGGWDGTAARKYHE